MPMEINPHSPHVPRPHPKSQPLPPGHAQRAVLHRSRAMAIKLPMLNSAVPPWERPQRGTVEPLEAAEPVELGAAGGAGGPWNGFPKGRRECPCGRCLAEFSRGFAASHDAHGMISSHLLTLIGHVNGQARPSGLSRPEKRNRWTRPCLRRALAAALEQHSVEQMVVVCFLSTWV